MPTAAWPELVEVEDEHFEKKLLLKNLLIGFPESFELKCEALSIPDDVRAWIRAWVLIIPVGGELLLYQQYQ